MKLAGMWFLLVCGIASGAVAALPLGKPPPAISLSGSAGGRLDGAPWSSTETKGKVTVLFYVDPDENDLYEPVAEAIRQEGFPEATFAWVAVVNLAASWRPAWLAARLVTAKQRKEPQTLYVRDEVKALVEFWGVADHGCDVILLDRSGNVVFSRSGKLSETETEDLVRLIRENL